MLNYLVKSNLDHDGKRYEAGQTVKLTERQAEAAREALAIPAPKISEEESKG